jgi:hypothetical protein
MQEPTWERNLPGHLFNRHDELHHTSEHKKGREQNLQDPKDYILLPIGRVGCHGHVSSLRMNLFSTNVASRAPRL